TPSCLSLCPRRLEETTEYFRHQFDGLLPRWCRLTNATQPAHGTAKGLHRPHFPLPSSSRVSLTATLPQQLSTMALVPFTPLNLRVDPSIPQLAAADSDMADESTTNTTNNSNHFRDRLSSMWQVVRSSDIQWGNTMNHTLGHLGRAALKAWGDRAHQAGQGPRAIATNIISSFGDEDDRVGNLAAVQAEGPGNRAF
ncbi:hypothetical protein B0H16DRAFT_1816025, partial [Mycena metata]